MAHAGAPWFDPKTRVYDVMEEIAEGAQHLYKLAAEGYGVLKEYLTKTKPAEGIVLLKNKRELSKRSNAFVKVRPYYVYPGALRYLFACASSYSESLQNYWENGKSISAFRFSWLYGGSQRLLKFVEDQMVLMPKGVGGLKGLSWGDDQFWVVICRNGDVVLFAPDVVAMDMSLQKNTIVGGYGRKMLMDYADKIDEVWKRVLTLQVQYSYNHPVLVHHSIVMQKSRGASSGVHNVTHIDMVGSARIMYRANKVFVGVGSADEAVVRMQALQKVIQVELGMTFKAETMVGALFKPGQKTISVPFLGMHTDWVTIDGVAYVVPIPDIGKLTASLFYAATSKTDTTRVSALLSKCVGLCASGGYTNLLFYHTCKRTYDFHKGSTVPMMDVEWMGGEVPKQLREFLDHGELATAKEFPTRRWFLQLYLPEGTLPASVAVGENKPTSVVTSEEEELLSFQLKPGASWADIDQASSSVAAGPDVDMLTAAPVTLPKVDKDKAGKFPPDLARRAIKLRRIEQRSLARIAERRLQLQHVRQKNVKYRGKAEDELDLDMEYEADFKEEREAELLHHEAVAAWEREEGELERLRREWAERFHFPEERIERAVDEGVDEDAGAEFDGWWNEDDREVSGQHVEDSELDGFSTISMK